jgi:hypothetical protein
MQLRELLTVDAESLTPAEAKQVAQDTIRVLASGVSASDQEPLKTLLIAAEEKVLGRKVGDPVQTGTRSRVRDLIELAEVRGDKQIARYLAEGMAAQDVAEADNSAQEALEAVNRYIANDIAEQEAARRKDLEKLVNIRTQELLFAQGWEITEEEARNRATKEIMACRSHGEEVSERE